MPGLHQMNSMFGSSKVRVWLAQREPQTAESHRGSSTGTASRAVRELAQCDGGLRAQPVSADSKRTSLVAERSRSGQDFDSVPRVSPAGALVLRHRQPVRIDLMQLTQQAKHVVTKPVGQPGSESSHSRTVNTGKCSSLQVVGTDACSQLLALAWPRRQIDEVREVYNLTTTQGSGRAALPSIGRGDRSLEDSSVSGCVDRQARGRTVSEQTHSELAKSFDFSVRSRQSGNMNLLLRTAVVGATEIES